MRAQVVLVYEQVRLLRNGLDARLRPGRQTPGDAHNRSVTIMRRPTASCDDLGQLPRGGAGLPLVWLAIRWPSRWRSSIACLGKIRDVLNDEPDGNSCVHCIEKLYRTRGLEATLAALAARRR